VVLLADPSYGEAVARVILVVNTDPYVLRAVEATLSGAGFIVKAVDSFPEARALLDGGDVDLVVADIRLGAYNGLHLAQRPRVADPPIAALITNGEPDVFFEHEAARAGAGFLIDPGRNPELLARVRIALGAGAHTDTPTRRWPRKVMPSPRHGEVAAKAVQIL